MSAIDLARLYEVSGTLVASPTALHETHGGTALGVVEDLVFRLVHESEPVREEWLGEVPVDVLDLGQTLLLGCSFLTWDADALAVALRGQVTTATASGRPRADAPAATEVGRLRSSRAVPLLFVPADADHHPFLYLPRAIPLPEPQDLVLAFGASSREALRLPVLIRALPDADGADTYRIFHRGEGGAP